MQHVDPMEGCLGRNDHGGNDGGDTALLPDVVAPGLASAADTMDSRSEPGPGQMSDDTAAYM